MQPSVLIPLRGGSKGVIRKNLRMLAGKPLFTYTCQAALDSGLETFVSTEDQDIKNEVAAFSKHIQIVDRPPMYAQDTSSTEDVISHFIEKHQSIEHIVLLQATSPFTTSTDIINALAMYQLSNGTQSLLSVSVKHEFFWDPSGYPINYEPSHRPRRQDWNGNYVENGAIYIFSAKSFIESRSRLVPPCLMYQIPPERCFEIDSENDLLIAQALMESKNGQ